MKLDKLALVETPLLNANAAPKDDPAKVKESARQFEALLIGQMLKSMRDSEGGWLGTGSDDLLRPLWNTPVGNLRSISGSERRPRVGFPRRQ